MRQRLGPKQRCAMLTMVLAVYTGWTPVTSLQRALCCVVHATAGETRPRLSLLRLPWMQACSEKVSAAPSSPMAQRRQCRGAEATPTTGVRMEGCRCTQRRCVVPQPLPVPLPFPQLFFGNTIHCRTSGSTAGRAGSLCRLRLNYFLIPSPTVQSGVLTPNPACALQGGRDGTGSEEWIQRGPKFVSGLTRLAATQEFKAVLVRQLLQLKAISGVLGPCMVILHQNKLEARTIRDKIG